MEQSFTKAIDLLYLAKQNGVDISLDEEQLQLKLPKNKKIDKSLLEELRINKKLIVDFLREYKKSNKNNNEITRFERDKTSLLPLSFSQERLWFIDQMEGSVQYHIPAVLRLQGNLDKDALGKALQNIVDRHEVLRTVFLQKEDGQAYQSIRDSENWQLEIIDGSSYAQDHKALQNYFQQLISDPFDLSKDYMVRASLITLAEHDHVLVVTMHHIASDGWSTSIIVKEVAELYAAYVKGRESVLTPLPLQYADYAIWQRNYLQGEVLDRKIDYWKQKLSGVTTLDLPTDHQRPAVRSARGASKDFIIDKGLSGQLQTLSQQQGTTLYMTLLATLNVLLYRYSGQQNICVGSPIANRTQEEIEGLIGFFVNTLALRSEVSGGTVFTDLLQQVRVTTMEAYEHQDVPFEKVVEVVMKERDLSRSPLFQVMLVLQNTPEVQKLHLGEVELSKEGFANATSKFDLSFFIIETAQGLKGSIEYATDLYNEDTITRMVGHFNTLLNTIVTRPEQKISELAMLPKAEERHLLYDFNDTKVDYPKDKSIIDLFAEQTSKTPEAIAVVFEKAQLTYKQLNERANQLARHLRKKGIREESLVPICIERGLEMVIGLLGILKAGAAFVPVDPEYPFDRIRYMLEDTGATTIISSKESKLKLKSLDLDIIDVDNDWPVIKKESIADLQIDSRPSHLAYVIYTSGSTGKPKGVMIEQFSVVNLIKSISNEVEFTSDSSLLSVTTFSFDICYLEFYVPLLSGGTLIIVPREVAMDGFKLAKSVSHYSPTHMQGTPSTWQLLIDAGWKNETAIKMLIGGEAVKESLKDQLTVKGIVFNLYGPTETTIWSAIKQLKKNEKVSIGKPLANTNIYILNDHLQICPVNIAGEVCIAGDGLARGYLHRPELTAEKFIKDPFNTEVGARMYRTGDLGRWLPDGNIEFIRRIDDQVKIRGYRIELGEIEAAVLKTELVNQVVVLAKENKEDNKRLVGYYIPKRPVIKEKERLLYEKQVENWKEIYETEYAKDKKNTDEEFDINIWNDSFTGKPIPEEQMHEWLNDIVNVILSTQPKNVLEIGCGSGLIYYQLAGKLKKYIGTDFSRSSIDHIKQRISKRLRDYGQTELKVCAAHEISLKEQEQVDTIILNSIVQYFPGEDYMTDVIAKSISLLKGKGRIIVGDVRDYRLLELFKGRLHIQKLQHSVSVQEFKWLTDQDVLKEEELCFSPDYFLKLQAIFPDITHIELKWKQSAYINELTLYRYTVIIHVGDKANVLKPDWQSWKHPDSKRNLIAQLQQKVDIVALKDMPNPRLSQEQILNKALKDKLAGTVGDLLYLLGKESEANQETNNILTIAQANGYQYELLLHEDPLLVNLLFELKPSSRLIQNPYNEISADTNSLFTNIPLFNDISLLLQKDLRFSLQQSLPEYMVPSELIALGQLPLTNNGKVDRKFLSERQDRAALHKLNFEPPRTKLEQALAGIWQELLGLQAVGVNDNFFEIGGHSLLAMRLISAIRRELKAEVPLIDIYESTIQSLAAKIETQQFSANLASVELKPEPNSSLSLNEISRKVHLLESGVIEWDSNGHGKYLIPIKENGTKVPFFGIISFKSLRLLGNFMPNDQPMYYLPPTQSASVGDIASHYVKEIKLLKPTGPYCIGGFCAGGMIALEIAQQLQAKGDKVLALVLFEHYSPEVFLSKRSLKYKKQKFFYYKNRLHNLNKSSRSSFDLLKYIFKKSYEKFKKPFVKSPPPKFITSPEYRKYAYKPYSGKVILFQASVPPLGIKESPLMGWSDYFTGEVEIITVDGGHLGIFREPGVEKLAEELGSVLKEVNDELK